MTLNAKALEAAYAAFAATGISADHEGIDAAIAGYLSALQALPQAGVSEEMVEAHPDDLAVDRFAVAMKAKLAKKRAEGRGGWGGPTCNAEILSQMLRKHVEKGDPVDVANFCMMLHQRGERITPKRTAPALPTAKPGKKPLPSLVNKRARNKLPLIPATSKAKGSK